MMMSDNRFNFDEEYIFEIYDTLTKNRYDGSVQDQEKLCILLNNLAGKNEQLQGKVKRLNAFIVSKDLAIEYLKWNKER